MAKRNDFLTGFLQGLYQSGVGNPEVQRANENATQERNANITTKMAEQGMVPGTLPNDHPVRQKIGGFISSMFGGASTPPLLASSFKPDPTQPQYGMDPTGKVNQFPAGQPITGQRMNPKAGSTTLASQYVDPLEKEYKQAQIDKMKKTSGKPPAGFRWTEDANLEPIPGGPVDLKTQTENQKKELALVGQKEKANLIVSKIDQALKKVGMTTTGAIGSVMKNVPGTKAKNLSSDLDTIKALLGFDQLAEMKNQSRAGASGLGALSEREMVLLTSARANLDQAQGQEQIAERLNEVKNHYENWLKMEEGINPYKNKPGDIPSGTESDPLGIR